MAQRDWKVFDADELVKTQRESGLPYHEFLRVRVGDQERAMQAGSILYVRATSAHSFFEIEEDITLMVFFASGGPSGS